MWSCVHVPTARQVAALGHDTAVRLFEKWPAFGGSYGVHAVPFHLHARFAVNFVPLGVYRPTATQLVGAVHAMSPTV